MAYNEGLLAANLVGPRRMSRERWIEANYGERDDLKPDMLEMLLALEEVRASQFRAKLTLN